jgi:hypothetical protein
MSEDLKNVIARMKQQSSQKSKEPEKKDSVKELKDEIDNGEFGDEPEETKEEKKVQTIQMDEFEFLERNGRYRSMLLFQLQEIRKEFAELNKAMIVIANILVEKK